MRQSEKTGNVLNPSNSGRSRDIDFAKRPPGRECFVYQERYGEFRSFSVRPRPGFFAFSLLRRSCAANSCVSRPRAFPVRQQNPCRSGQSRFGRGYTACLDTGPGRNQCIGPILSSSSQPLSSSVTSVRPPNRTSSSFGSSNSCFISIPFLRRRRRNPQFFSLYRAARKMASVFAPCGQKKQTAAGLPAAVCWCER